MTLATAPPHETEVRGEEIEVTPRIAMAYSAGLLLEEERFYWGAGAPPVVAPFLCARLEWPVTLGFRNVLQLSPSDAARSVHAAQDTEVHRPFALGERIVVHGEMVEAKDTRAGALTVIRYQTRSLTAGDVVTTSWSSAIYRGVPLPIRPFQKASPPPLPPPSVEDDARLAHLRFPIHLTHVYSECADIWNPIHTEDPAARAAGLPCVIVHGTILWALAGVRLADLRLGGDMNRIRRFSGKFQAPVFPKSTARLVVFGEGPVLGWRLEDEKNGRVHVSGAALVADD